MRLFSFSIDTPIYRQRSCRIRNLIIFFISLLSIYLSIYLSLIISLPNHNSISLNFSIQTLNLDSKDIISKREEEEKFSAKININTYDFNALLQPIYKSIAIFVCDQIPIFSVLFIYSSPVIKNLTIHSFHDIYLINQVLSIFVFVTNTIFERILFISQMVIKFLVTNLRDKNPEKLLDDFSDIKDFDNHHANIFRINSTPINNQLLVVLIPMFLFVNFAHKYFIQKKSENSTSTGIFLEAKIYLSIFIIYLFFILCFIGCQNYPLSITISLFITPRVYKLTYNLLNGVKCERNLLYFMDFVLLIILALVYYYIFISNKYKSIELLEDLLISLTAIFSTVNDSIKNHLYLSLPCYSLLSLSYSFSICTFRIKYWKF